MNPDTFLNEQFNRWQKFKKYTGKTFAYKPTSVKSYINIPAIDFNFEKNYVFALFTTFFIYWVTIPWNKVFLKDSLNLWYSIKKVSKFKDATLTY